MSASVAAPSSSQSASMPQKPDGNHYVKKPAPLDLRMASQDSTNTFLHSSTGQKTPPAVALAMATLNLDGSNKEKKIGHRRVDETTGQVTYKKKATTDLMKAIQLGIGNSVGSLTSKPTRDVLMQDFSVVETVHFPENGSNLTPAHRVGEFKFKTYAPIAFRYFREIFGIQTDDFLISLTSLPLLELSNPGASGSVFFITEDDEFIIKTVQHKEADFLQKLLPGYYMNLNQNPRTLLPKFYGLYCLQTGGKNIRLCVMNNLLPKAIRKSEKYDLKGSTYKRKASKHELAKSSPTFKDLDFMERNSDGILLESETYEALLKTMKRDVRVLESFKIMDYSLLLSVYNVDETKRRQLEDGHRQADSTATTPQAVEPSTSTASAAPAAVGGAAAGAEGNVATPGPITRGRSTKYRLQNFSTALESIQAVVAEPADSDDVDVPPGGIPARNVKGERLLLYVGIIDILQSYRLKKKLEHGFKSIVYDGDAISVHRPSFYAHRFQTFFEKEVFKKVDSPIRSPSKKKSASRQRSVPEAAVSASAVAPEENADVVENEGALLNKGKPDIIPDPPTVSVRGAESRLSSDSSSTLDPTQSSSEGAAVTFTASHQGAAKVSMYSGKGKESTTATTSSSYVSCSSSIYVGPPLDDGAPPPYSETAPLMTPAAENGQAGDGESVFKKQPVQPFPNMFGHQSAGRDHTSCSSEEESEENFQLFPETHRSLGLVAAGPSISSDIPPAIETEQTFL